MFRKKDVCKVHRTDKIFYCIDCAKPVCPVCFYELEEHRGHQKKMLEEVFEEKKDSLSTQLQKLKAKENVFKARGEEMK